MSDKLHASSLPPSVSEDRVHALLSLAPQDVAMLNTACPDDATLATFVEGKLTGIQRERVLQHVQHCPSCYEVWQLSAEALPTASRYVKWYERWVDIKLHVQTYWLSLSAGALAAALAITVCVPLLLPLTVSQQGMQLSKAVDSLYVGNTSQNADRMTIELWFTQHGNQLGFSAQKTTPTQGQLAFTAGAWTGKRQLANQSVELPANLMPSYDKSWQNSAWEEEFELGRWLVVLWNDLQQVKELDWHQQYTLTGQFHAAFDKRIENASMNMLLTELEMHFLQLEKEVQNQKIASPRLLEKLQRRIGQFLQQEIVVL